MTKEHQAVISRLENLKGWIKDIQKGQDKLFAKVEQQNGRVYTNEKDIALLRQAAKIEGGHRDQHIFKIETWSMNKRYIIFGAIVTFLFTLIQYLFQRHM